MSSDKEKVRNILIVAITRLGDMLQATPTLLGLKEHYPNAKLTVAIEKQFAGICEGIPCIDEIVELDLSYVCRCLAREQDGIVEGFNYLGEKLEYLRAKNFDFSLNMSSSAYTALLLKMLHIEDCRGWVSDDEGHRIISSPWAMLFSAFVYHSNRDYNSLNLVDIFRCASGVDRHPKRLKYEINEDGRSFAEAYVAENRGAARGPVICIQAGASQEKRQWSTTRFAQVAEILIRDLDAQLIFTGSRSELPIIEKIVSEINHPNVSVAAGKTNLPQLAGLLEKAEVLITGDTGPMHLAVAVGTPVVSIFLASALCFETGPYSEGNLVVQPLIGCNPCNPNLSCSRPDCHDQVTPELVAYLTKARLSSDSPTLSGVKIPRELADPRDLAIYVTTFDTEGFLDFKRLNEVGLRHGRSEEFFICARETYRTLWKTEFGFSSFRESGRDDITAVPEDLRQGIAEVRALCEVGRTNIQRLAQLIRDPKSPPNLLGETTREIAQIDKDLEAVGLGHPILGALVRVFIMEKENMRGDDPLVLASEMTELYGALGRRSERFLNLFARAAAKRGVRFDTERTSHVGETEERLYSITMGAHR